MLYLGFSSGEKLVATLRLLGFVLFEKLKRGMFLERDR